MIKFKPLGDRALIRRIEENDNTGSIIIPEIAKEKPSRGEVLAVGLGKFLDDGTRRPLDVTAGDRVLYGKFSGHEIKVDDETLLVMREEEIFGIILQK